MDIFPECWIQSLSLVSIKPITTTDTTNFELKQSDKFEGWLLKLINALFLCRGRGICRVMEIRLYRWHSYNKNHLAQEAISTFSFTKRQWQYIPTYLKIRCWYNYYKSHVVLQSVNKIQATLQMMGQAVTKNGLLK